MKIISVAAQLNSGKDVFSDYLAEVLNKNSNQKWIRSAFANAVKDTFCKAFDVDRNFIEKWKRIPEPPPGMLMPVRQGLQFIGDGFRKIKDEIWIEIALRSDDNLIISDSRYINEAKAVKAKGGAMFIMYRPGFLNDDPNPSEAQIRPLVDFCIEYLNEGPIPSYELLLEKHGVAVPDAIRHYDYFLVNDGTVNDLYRKVDSQVIPFLKGWIF
jgi:hypothetical protein